MLGIKNRPVHRQMSFPSQRVGQNIESHRDTFSKTITLLNPYLTRLKLLEGILYRVDVRTVSTRYKEGKKREFTVVDSDTRVSVCV